MRVKRGEPMPEHLAKAIEAAGGKVSRPNKFGAIKENGYDSKAEARYALELGIRKQAKNGDVLDWLEQVPIELSCGTYRCDFLVFFRDGTWKLVEIKGFETDSWKLKKRALEKERPELFARLEVRK
jgi:hypothetical protein